MELSFAKCESIVNSLPIGFYTGRRVEVGLSETEPTSYYSPMEDKIMVSYPIIAHRLKQVANGCDEEEAVRSMLYHEVSHAILTPSPEVLENDFTVNCFEDERIETVLRHYFHGVDFRKQLLDIHGGHIPEAKNAQQAFFNAVRFGTGSANIQKDIKKLLEKSAEINRATGWYGKSGYGSYGTYEYRNDIRALYKKIARAFKDDPESFNAPNSKGKQQEMDGIRQNQKNPSEGEGEGEETTAKIPGEDEGEESNEAYKGEPHEIEMSEEDVKRMVGACLSSKPNLDDYQCQKLDEFQKTAEMIIGNFNKRNSGGSGINAYSGVFNPRAVVRKDYRFFDRTMTTNGNNKFGTCHLNLIIDCSGSFERNVPLTNGILAVLTEIERKNRNFTMDVAFINHEFHLCQNVKERQMTAWGGNAIPDNMKEILMKLQKPQTCNYNIILFDGDAICQNYTGKNCNKLFSVFDMKQTTLITDPDNEIYMNPPFTSTKVVVTQEYTDKLIDNIIRALTIAFG